MKNLTDAELVQLFSHVPRFGRAFWGAPPEPPEGLPDIGMSHVKTIVFLRLHGASPMSRVAAWVNLEKGSFTPVARRLVEAGLVETVADEADRRRTLPRLTEAGADYDKALHERMSEGFRRRVSVLTEAEQEEFLRLLSRMNALLDKMSPKDGKPPFPETPHVHPFHGPAPRAQEGTRPCSD